MTTGWAVRVPGSSANLGAGFDVLGMAIGLHVDVGCGPAPPDAHAADEHHPATVAFRRGGGDGPLWSRTRIPMGRGLGYSGAVRVGGAAAALVQREGTGALADVGGRRAVLDIAAELEHHADNAAASLIGGIVVVAGAEVVSVPLAFDPTVVVWIPDAATTSTERSRSALPAMVTRSDAVYNLGRVAMFVVACALGDPARLRTATEDRLHQPIRLREVPSSAAALDAGLANGAWAAWLSGSGPTVAMLCDRGSADALAASLPAGGHAKIVDIDRRGTVVIDVAR